MREKRVCICQIFHFDLKQPRNVVQDNQSCINEIWPESGEKRKFKRILSKNLKSG